MILIMESNIDLANIIKEVVIGLGYKALIAETSDESADILKTKPVEVVILNAFVRGNRIQELSDELCKRNIKLIVTSTGARPKINCDLFLKAPYSLSDLESSILKQKSY